jgi:hypothetical protein
MTDTYASRDDLIRVEHKVEDLGKGLASLAAAVTSLSERLAVRDATEKQAQILKAEIDEGQRALKLERERNMEAWTSLKTRALWSAMMMLLLISSPNIASVIRQAKGLMP